MTNAIVQTNVSVTLAPTPSTVQQSGAFISQGGTTLADGTLGGPYTQLSQILGILSSAIALTNLSWSGSVVTGTTATPHGWGIGDVIGVVIAGAAPAAYNGTFTATVTGASAFTYPLASNPGTETTPGSVVLASESEILQMATTYFSNNSAVGVYILELGEGSVNSNITQFATWLAVNNSYTPQLLYSVLVPRSWDGNSSFIALCGNYTSPTSKFYFFVTTTYANRNLYASLKCVNAGVEAPGIPTTEFSRAAVFSTTLSWQPSSTARVPPLFYTNSFGVTPYPPAGNGATFTGLAAANVNWTGTGAEGGLSNAIEFRGKLQDGTVFNFWYSGDWVQFNMDLALSNEIINGSNSTVNPLYYDQPGINRLQNRGLQVLSNAVTNGLGNGTVIATTLPSLQFIQNYNNGVYAGFNVLNAEPFLINAQENPSDYGNGIYRGLTSIFTPSQGFQQIIFNLNLTDIIAPV